MARNGRKAGERTEISVICPSCEAAIHVPLEAYVDGEEAPCPDCGVTCDLGDVDDGLVSKEILLDRVPAEAREALAPIISEFPSSA